MNKLENGHSLLKIKINIKGINIKNIFSTINFFFIFISAQFCKIINNLIRTKALQIMPAKRAP